MLRPEAPIAIGPRAEKAVQRCLGHTDDGVRQKGCEILKVIGTKRSVKALQNATNDRNDESPRLRLRPWNKRRGGTAAVISLAG